MRRDAEACAVSGGGDENAQQISAAHAVHRRNRGVFMRDSGGQVEFVAEARQNKNPRSSSRVVDHCGIRCSVRSPDALPDEQCPGGTSTTRHGPEHVRCAEPPQQFANYRCVQRLVKSERYLLRQPTRAFPNERFNRNYPCL